MKQLLFAVILLADPRPVFAGSSCGGGGGGNGGGSSGGSSSGGSSSGGSSSSSSSSSGGDYSSSSESSSSGTSGGCFDDTDVHGFRHCTKFGVWGKNMRIPRFFIEAGGTMRSFPSSLGGTTGSISHGAESFSYRVVMPTADSQRDFAMSSTLRVGFGVTRGLYSGLEMEFGSLVSPASASAEMTSTGTYGSPNVEQQHGTVIGFTGIGGYRVSGSRGSLALEGAGGLRMVRYAFASQYHNCATDTVINATTSVIEARARAELWLNPWLTAGVSLGSNVLDRGDWMAGFYFGAHSRAFAGTR